MDLTCSTCGEMARGDFVNTVRHLPVPSNKDFDQLSAAKRKYCAMEFVVNLVTLSVSFHSTTSAGRYRPA
jgi:hypothetical protein